ncbi:hypothetical protein F8M41_019637 [Gigaspora margarita]|uniref:Uncharacterized protein n=1 Tax=Gigaspora margarita TaxID=4874 RepID=A0A8H4AJN8_GIGMA|nr:hypothetical protein F8M41_019637 [Gigaspora margarita]
MFQKVQAEHKLVTKHNTKRKSVNIMEKVIENFTKVTDELEQECQRNIKKMKKLYKNDQNKGTGRAESSLTLASNNIETCDQEIISEIMDQNQNTTTNTNIEVLVVEVQVSEQENSYTENT